MRRVLPAALIVVLAIVLGVQAQQPPQPAQEPAGRGRGGRGAQPGLEPRIVSFEARPATVRVGEPVVLVWSTENPAGGVSIDQEIGAVNARGSRTVTPKSTTTFTLTMRGGPSRSVTVTVEAGARSAAVSSAAGVIPRLPNGQPAIPLTLDGHPDLTGVYGSAGLPAGTMPPPVKPGAEKFRIVRGPDDIRRSEERRVGKECRSRWSPET